MTGRETTANDEGEEEKNSSNTNHSNAAKDVGLWRDLSAYWILGLCNNYGYVVMLTAAHAIIKDLEVHKVSEQAGHVPSSKFYIFGFLLF